jgi:hypothetical protein
MIKRDVSFNRTRAAMSIRPCGEIGDTNSGVCIK